MAKTSAKVKELEEAVMKLRPPEYEEFLNWILEWHHERWDRQIERDAEAGRLDDFAKEALEEHRKGLCRKL